MLVKKLIKLLVYLVVFILLFPHFTQGGQEPPKLDGKMRTAVIEGAIKELTGKYVFPEVAEKIGKLLKKNLKKGKYDGYTDAPQFSRALTVDIRSVNNDRHLWITYSPGRAERIRRFESTSEEEKKKARAKFREEARLDNFGFDKVEVLEGNVGYLKMNRFYPPEVAGKTAAGAMAFLANSDALVIDLRTSSGGSPHMVQMLCSYFFEEPTHINSFENRSREPKWRQFWTLPFVPGKVPSEIDLYVLTSKRVFSAAEEFAYDLKHLKRATIVGEQTRGGAHPGDTLVVEKDYVMFIPFGRAVNPVTGTNWEGVGVTPHVEVTADKALTTAHIMALEKLKEKADDLARKNALDWTATGIKIRVNPVKVEKELLEKYAGTYDPDRVLVLEGDTLVYKVDDFQSRLIPITKTTFQFEVLGNVRVDFISDDQGRVTGARVYYDDGRELIYKKIK